MEPNLCVLMDFENIAAGAEKEGHGRFDTSAVMTRLKEKGRILISRSYGDWGRFAKYKQAMLEQSIQAVELTSYRGQDKNRADIALAVDAMELAFRRDYIDTFVLLSGDSDFTPLVMRLRELDRRVIGIGTRKSSSRLLVESCDEFIFYESIVRSKRSSSSSSNRGRSSGGRSSSSGSSSSNNRNSDAVESLSKDDAFALLTETIEGIQRDEPGGVLAGRIKQSILRKTPSFDESEYGFAGFARFLEGARERNLVSLRTDERAGGYRVDVAEDGSGSEEAPTGGDEPLLKGEPGRLREVLVKAGHDPLTSMMRHVVVHEFVDHVTERARKNKRNTLLYTVGDVARRTRQTDPPVRSRQVRSVLYTLMAAGELIHADGDPIRKDSATYTIQKDAEELLRVLRGFYVKQLLSAHEDLSDSEALSQFLWGDDAHAHAAEELVAWAQWELTEDDGKAPPAKVVATPEEAEARGAERKAKADGEDKSSAKKSSSRRRSTKKAESAKEADIPDPLEEEEAPKKRRRRRKKKTETDEGAEKADETADEKPKKKRTTRKKTTTKKAAEEGEADSGEAEKPTAKKTTAKKSTAKKATAKKSTAKKTTAKKSTAKKTTAKKTTAKKSTTKKAADDGEEKPKKKRAPRKKTTTKKAADEGGDKGEDKGEG